MILKVVGVKDPVLRLKAKPVGKVDKKVAKLIANMQDTLRSQKDPEGVGLAAPQVGRSFRIFLVSYKGESRVVINPVVLEISKTKPPHSAKATRGKKKDILEGCLSLPHYYGPIKRAPSITLEYLNQTGEKVTEKFEGFLAQIVQHELDHLNGVLFVDHILKQKAPLYKFRGNEWEEVQLA